MNQHQKNDIQNADQFGYQITARLSGALENLPQDISERLRAARVRAIDRRKWVLMQGATEVFALGHLGSVTTAGQGGFGTSWWNKLGMAGLVLTLVTGLFVINIVQDDLGVRELADVDSALLTDDLPPAAYIDPGFSQFLKITNNKAFDY
ncbi:hypothetical protein GALL_451950 [mine drainage metagenome]|uniref:DUF3619 family protein n=1 Tax=mine drainage metagenome TaxID=410659 RepID=A0A1J5PNU9_9ZZZZ